MIWMILFLLIIAFFIYSYKKTKKLYEVGKFAALTFIYTGDEVAKIAVKTVASTTQGQNFREFLDVIYSLSLPESSSNIDSMITNQEILFKELNMIKPSLKLSMEYKIELSKIGKNWLQAINTCNENKAIEIFKEQVK